MRSLSWTGLVALALVAGCTQIADFDRGLIPEADPGQTEGGMPEASTEGGSPEASMPEASMPEASMPDAETDGGSDGEVDADMPVCDVNDHTGCQPDELCCVGTSGDAECQATGVGQCESCAVACDDDATSGCTDRQCVCGTGAACSGDTDLCDDATGTCVECDIDDDCADPEGQCVAGVCLECDFPGGNNAGCADTTPVCASDGTCEACDNDDDCDGILVCDMASGRCTGCTGVNTGCSNPLPACNGTTNSCEACDDDADCVGNPDGTICSGGVCGPCNRDTDDGCSGTTPACRESGDTSACQPCSTKAEVCTDDGLACDSTGSCVDCTFVNNDVTCEIASADPANCTCRDTPATPYCDDDQTVRGSRTCVECLVQDHCGDQACVGQACINCSGDSQCDGHPIGPECVSGNCQLCDPAGNSGCSGATPFCLNGTSCEECGAGETSACTGGEVCNLASNTCVECNDNGDDLCGGQACIGNACAACTMDADCAGHADGSQCVSGVCQLCDPADNAGCGGQQCLLGTSCVACIVDGDCTTPGVEQCVDNVCRACDPGDDAGCGTGGEPGNCDAASFTCNCLDDGDCAGVASGSACDVDNICKPCVDDGDCSGNTPLCESNSCVGCNTLAEGAGDARCTGVCARAGTNIGACTTCDPDNDPVDNTTQNPACTAGGGLNMCLDDGSACVNCVDSADCGTDTAPRCVTNSCAVCDQSFCDAADPGSVCITVGGRTGACDPCDPSTNPADNNQGTQAVGCTGTPAQPLCLADGSACVGCLDDSDCAASATAPLCEGGTCVDCNLFTGDSNAACNAKSVGTTCSAVDGSCSI